MNKSQYALAKLDEMETYIAEQQAHLQELEDAEGVEEGRKLKAAGLAGAAAAGGAAYHYRDKLKAAAGMGGGGNGGGMRRLARHHNMSVDQFKDYASGGKKKA